MAGELASMGCKLKWASETTANTKPSTGFVAIANITSIGSMNFEPGTIQVTDLDALHWHKYIGGLSDPGGSIAINCNLTAALKTAWDACRTAYDALTGGKGMWFEVAIPGMSDSFFIRAEPSEFLGPDEIGVDSAVTVTLYITPNGDPEWDTAST